MVQMQSKPPHLESLHSTEVLVSGQRRKLGTSEGLWKVTTQRLDPPETRERTWGSWASAELRVSKHGSKLSQGQTAVTQNSSKFTSFTHLILQRKGCDVFINTITVLRYLSQMVWNVPRIGTVYPSYQVGKGFNVATSTQICFFQPIQLARKPASFVG